MFRIVGDDVFVGDVKRGKVEKLLLFVGVKDESSWKYHPSKNGFCLFFDKRFWIQDGSFAIRVGVADPYASDGLFQGVIWSWQARKTDHLLCIRDRRFIIPFGASMLSFESEDGSIAVCSEHVRETAF